MKEKVVKIFTAGGGQRRLGRGGRVERPPKRRRGPAPGAESARRGPDRTTTWPASRRRRRLFLFFFFASMAPRQPSGDVGDRRGGELSASAALHRCGTSFQLRRKRNENESTSSSPDDVSSETNRRRRRQSEIIRKKRKKKQERKKLPLRTHDARGTREDSSGHRPLHPIASGNSPQIKRQHLNLSVIHLFSISVFGFSNQHRLF